MGVLVLDTPTILLERWHLAFSIPDPAMLARRRQPEHPVAQLSRRHRRTETGLELAPCAFGLEDLPVTGLDFEIRRHCGTRHLQAHTADSDRTANLHVRAILVLLPRERARSAITAAGHAEASTRLPVRERR